MTNILLLMPKALYVLLRFGEACRRQGLDLTVMMASNPPQSRYLASFVNDTYQNVSEISVAEDDAGTMAPLLPRCDGVVAGSEFSVVLAEELALRLGVFHNPLDRVQAYRNKYLMRAAFAEHGVDQPRILARFRSMEEVDRFAWDAINVPVIVKPVDLTASLHVRLCDDAASARKVLQRIFKHAKSFAGSAFAGEGLLEEAVFGPEYSAECVIQDGELVRSFITTKFLSPYPACDEIAHLSGEELPAPLMEKVRAAVLGIIEAWRLGSAVIHVEFKICQGEVKVIEAACRVGGDMISEIVELRYGVSLEECVVLLRAGRDVRAALAKPACMPSARYYAIKYRFAENFDAPVPTGTVILREVRAARSDTAPRRMGAGFGVERRLGHQILASESVACLRGHLAELGGDGKAPGHSLLAHASAV